MSSYTGELSTPEEWSLPAKMVAKFPLSMIISEHCQVRSFYFSCQYFPFPPSERATKSCFRQKRKVRVTKLGELSCEIQNMSIENNLWYHSLVSSIFLLSLSLIKILWVLQATLWWPRITSQPDWSALVRF